MKKLLILAIAAAAIGIPAYLWYRSSTFGVDPNNPLGRFETVDRWLADKGFARATAEVDEDTREKYGEELQGATLYVYTHEYTERMDSRRSVVAVALDAAGRIAALRTSFRSGAEELQVQFSPSLGEAFTNRMWFDLAGGKPTFRDEMSGGGRFARQLRVARFERGGVSCKWVKTYMSNGEPRSIFDGATFVRDGAATPGRD